MRLLIAAALLLMYLPALAEDFSLPERAHNLIDSGLVALDMDRGGLWMPWDAYPDDDHRLNVVKDLFAEPLKTFDAASLYAQWALQNPNQLAQEMMPILRLGTYKAPSLVNMLPARRLDEMLDTRLDSSAGAVAAAIIRQYLAPMLVADERVRESRGGIRYSNYALLQQKIDSLQMYSEESSRASVYELKSAERAEEQAARNFFAAARDAEKLQALYSAGIGLHAHFNSLLKTGADLREYYSKELKTVTLESPYGRIAIGGPGDDLYEGDYLFIFDVGGNDTYLAKRPEGKNDLINHPVRCLIDLDGDDVYLGGNYCLGSSMFGIDLLYDLSGDDTYAAGDFSLGSAMFGVAILEDRGGNDTYKGGVFTQGAAAFGIAMCIDGDGNDVWRAAANGQGFGFTRGFGAVIESRGNDHFITSSPYQDFLRYEQHFISFTQGAGLGYRPYASGGIGMLSDFHGNDTYVSDIYGQGTAYWYALGMLVDGRGDDRYVAYQYAQGAGVHLAHGVLLDVMGNDNYLSHGVSQGCGHDIAFGGLIDLDGDDDYIAESLSQGGGNANAVSLLLDSRGNDAYSARTLNNMQGFSDFRREYGMVGLFVDGAGRDLYTKPVSDSVHRKSTYGVFRDMEMALNEQVATGDAPESDDADSSSEERDPLAGDIDSLFTQASAAPQKYQYNVQPAREKIRDMLEAALPYLAGRLSTESARERHALTAVMQLLHDTIPAPVVKQLRDSLRSTDPRTVLMCLSIVGRIKDPGVSPELHDLIAHSNWRIRSAAALQLGKMGAQATPAALERLLDDQHIHVRMRAAYALGLLMPPNLLQIAGTCLSDKSQLVRNGFIEGLQRGDTALKPDQFRSLYRLTNSPLRQARIAALITRVDSNLVKSTDVGRWMEELPADAREAMYSAVDNSELWRKLVYNNRRKEPLRALRELIDAWKPS